MTTALIPLAQLALMAVWVAILHVNVFPPARKREPIGYGYYERVNV
jgi:hypothetical protein